MKSDLNEEVSIALPKAAWLVVSELLARSNRDATNPDNRLDEPIQIRVSEHGERVALWWLEAALEKTLSEIFASDYTSIIEACKQQLSRSN